MEIRWQTPTYMLFSFYKGERLYMPEHENTIHPSAIKRAIEREVERERAAIAESIERADNAQEQVNKYDEDIRPTHPPHRLEELYGAYPATLQGQCGQQETTAFDPYLMERMKQQAQLQMQQQFDPGSIYANPMAHQRRIGYERELAHAKANVERLTRLLRLFDKNPEFEEMLELSTNKY